MNENLKSVVSSKIREFSKIIWKNSKMCIVELCSWVRAVVQYLAYGICFSLGIVTPVREQIYLDF